MSGSGPRSGSGLKQVSRSTSIPSTAAVQRLMKSAGVKKSSDQAKARVGEEYRNMVEDVFWKCMVATKATKTPTLSVKLLNIVLNSMGESVLAVPKTNACKSKTAMKDVYKRCELVPRGSFDNLIMFYTRKYKLKSSAAFKLALQYHVESKMLDLVKSAYVVTTSRPDATTLMERDIGAAMAIKN